MNHELKKNAESRGTNWSRRARLDRSVTTSLRSIRARDQPSRRCPPMDDWHAGWSRPFGGGSRTATTCHDWLGSALRRVVYATPAQSGWATRPKTAWRSPHAGLAGAGLPRRNPLPCSFVLDRSDGARTVVVSDCHRTEGTQPAPLLPADQLPTTDGDADDDDVRPSPRRLPPSPVHLPSTFIFGVMAFVAAASVALSSAATTARATCQYVVFSSLLFL